MEQWILKKPDWTKTSFFGYESVHFWLIIVLILTGVAICFMGYKYFQTLCTVLLGILVEIIVIRATESITESEILKMSLLVASLYLIIALIHFLLKSVRKMLEKFGVWILLLQIQYVIAAFVGAGIVAVVCYSAVYQSLLCAVLLFVVLAIAGSLHGKREVMRRPVFHSYDDLCARKPLGGEDGNA